MNKKSAIFLFLSGFMAVAAYALPVPQGCAFDDSQCIQRTQTYLKCLARASATNDLQLRHACVAAYMQWP